jgi:serine/threonine protein kinase
MSADDPTAIASAPPDGGAPRGNALPAGTLVQEFQIEGLVGEGGFSVVYRAHDTLLGRTIALKEYMPAALAQRTGARRVEPRTERQRSTFELGLRSFVNEARLLASFDHPALVKVYRFWEENGTAYLVMPLYQGLTLREWLARDAGGTIAEAQLIGMLHPLLDALEVMHAQQCYHRDIAPDNILLLDDDAGPSTLRPVLLDFGAARRVIGDATQALTVILKPGYAPIEQYADTAPSTQGPWTDIYALCATLYFAVTGRVPGPSVGRLMRDDLVPASVAARGAYSPTFLAAIDAGMAVKPEDRTPSVPALRELLSGRAAPATQPPAHDHDATVILGPQEAAAALAAARGEGTASTWPTPTPTTRPANARTNMAPATTSVASTRAAANAATDAADEASQRSGSHPVGAARSAERRSGVAPALVATALVLAGLAAGAWWWTNRPPAASPVDPRGTAAVAVPPADATSAKAPAGADNTANDARAPASTTATASDPTPGADTRAAAGASATPEVRDTAASRPPFGVLTALRDIVEGADPGIVVKAVPTKQELVIGRDRLEFRVEASQAGWVYVYSSGTDQSHFYLLFPNPADRDNRIAAGRALRLPRSSWSLVSAGPAGTNHLLVVVSRSPRDLTGTGLVTRADSFPEWDLDAAAARWGARAQRDASPFVGRTACAAGNECPPGYGASLVQLEEVARAAR